jgi:hypothetical protein
MSGITVLSDKARTIAWELESNSSRRGSRLRAQDEIIKTLKEADLGYEAAIFESMTRFIREVVVEGFRVRAERRIPK